MKIHRFLFLMLLLPVLAFAQETSVCEKNGEVMPNWVCNSDTVDGEFIQSIGTGKSYNQAIVLALCETSVNYITTSKQAEKNKEMSFEKQDEAGGGDDEMSVDKHVSKLHYGENIVVDFVRQTYLSKEHGSLMEYNCNLRVATKYGEIRVREFIQESTENSETKVDADSRYIIPPNVEIDKVLMLNSVEIRKAFISNTQDFYIPNSSS